jgi:hypothetical protein
MSEPKIAVFDHRLLPEVKKQIQSLSSKPIIFPAAPITSEQELISKTDHANIILTSPWDKITANYLDACPTVKYIGLCGTSTANIDLDELNRRHIAFTNVVDYGDEPTAEFIFMRLVALARGVGQYQWKTEQRELMGKTLGIIGLGALGRAVASLALAYKMNIVYYSLHRHSDWEQRGLRYMKLPDMLAASDIAVVCSPSNRLIMAGAEFAHLRQGSILVQASAGTVLDEQSFLNWIAQEDNFALFDQAAGEQNYLTYKDLPRVLFADVVAGDTHETLERLGQKVIDNLKAYLQ